MILRGLEITAWFVAFPWLTKVVEASFGMPRIANLLGREYDREPHGMPSVTVIVPGRNEERDVAACLESLLAQDYAPLQIVAVDDRSTDSTGTLMDGLAADHPNRLQTVHIRELPPDWLGKTHAMAVVAAGSESDWLLFTDADILFRADCLRRSLVYAVESGADHLVTVPTPVIRRWDEGMILGFFQIFGMWGARPWKIANPRARFDAIGVGAFNLVRRGAYEQVGGFEALRMEIVEGRRAGSAHQGRGAGAAHRLRAGIGARALGVGSVGPGQRADEEPLLGVPVPCVAGAGRMPVAGGLLRRAGAWTDPARDAPARRADAFGGRLDLPVVRTCFRHLRMAGGAFAFWARCSFFTRSCAPR